MECDGIGTGGAGAGSCCDGSRMLVPPRVLFTDGSRIGGVHGVHIEGEPARGSSGWRV